MENYFRLRKLLTHGGCSGGVVMPNGELFEIEMALEQSVRYAVYWDDVDGPLGDLLCPDSNPMIVSHRALAVLRDFELPPGTRFGTVHVYTEGNGTELGIADAIIFPDIVDVMDPEDTLAYERMPMLDRINGIGPLPRINHKLTSGYDLVAALRVMNICSACLKTAIERAKLTNFCFVPLAVK